MRIGVAYCGGCNPRYDRGRKVQLLKEKLKDLGHEVVNGFSDEDGARLVMQGCLRRCALAGISEVPVISIDSETFVEEILKKIEG